MSTDAEQTRMLSADFRLAAERRRSLTRNQKGVEQDRPVFRPINAKIFANSPLASHHLSSAESTSNGS